MKVAALIPGLLAMILAGCDSTPKVEVVKPPHGGSLFTAIEGKKNVEIVRQDAPVGKVQFLAYFLDDQLKPQIPAPSAASFKPKAPRGVVAVELKPKTEESSAMASPELDDQGGIAGELSATIDGKPVVYTINVR